MRKTRFNPDKFHFNQIPMYLVLVPLALFMALPIVFIINHAFKPIDELFAFPPRFFVENPVVDNFVKLARQASAGGISISRYIFNSVIVTFSVVFLSMLFSSMAAFAALGGSASRVSTLRRAVPACVPLTPAFAMSAMAAVVSSTE